MAALADIGGRELTVKLLQHPLDGARAAAAGHCDVEVVVVVRHAGRVFQTARLRL